MLNQSLITTINHLLEQSGWAGPRLAKFKGKIVQFDVAPFTFACAIEEDGSLASAARDASADAIIRLAPSLLLRLAIQDEAAYEDIQTSGDAVLADEVLLLMRNLRWDAAEDLSKVTGDVAAERMVQFAQHGKKVLREGVQNLSQAAVEYLTEERPLLAKPVHISGFAEQVGSLRAEVDKLEHRINQLLKP